MQQFVEIDNCSDDMEQFDCDPEDDDYKNVMPTNNKSGNVYKESVCPSPVLHLPNYQRSRKMTPVISQRKRWLKLLI